MKKYLFLTVLLLILHVPVIAQTAEVWLSPETVYYADVDWFNISVNCNSELSEAKSFHFELTFDPSVVMFPRDSIKLGSMFSGLYDNETVMYTNYWNDATHLEIDFVFLTDSATVSGPGELLNLSGLPIEIGQTIVEITNVLIFDQYNQLMPVSVVGASTVIACPLAAGDAGPCCCEGVRGDVNGDGTDLDIVDLTCIVDWLFGIGCYMPCPLEADVNGDGEGPDGPDIVDLTFNVDWLFGDTPDLVQCW